MCEANPATWEASEGKAAANRSGATWTATSIVATGRTNDQKMAMPPVFGIDREGALT